MSAEQENAQWAEPGSDYPPLNAFKVRMEKEVDEINRSYGGPAQYRQPEQDEFAKYLWESSQRRMKSSTTTTIPSNQ